MVSRYLKILAVAALLLGGCTQEELEVKDAWIRAAPDGRALGAAYLTLVNNGPATEITAVQSAAHAMAGLHRSETAKGVARMRELENIPVAKHAVTRFEPGALHIMLMRQRRPLRVGDSVELTLKFSDGREISFAAQVKTEP